MHLKIVACDFDKTLTGGVPISSRIKDFMIELREKNVKFIINSGRYLQDILEILSESKVSCPEGYPEAIISEQGVFIHYLEGNHYVEDEEWNREKKKELGVLSQEIGWKSKLWEKLVEQRLKIKPLKKKVGQGVFKIAFNNSEEAEKVRQALVNEGNFKYTTFLRNRHYLLAGLSTAQKGRSLLRVAEHFEALPGQVLAIGDSHNDEDMLDGKYGFVPAAPSNAEEQIKILVKKHKGYVSSLPEGEGVVEIVNFLSS